MQQPRISARQHYIKNINLISTMSSKYLSDSGAHSYVGANNGMCLLLLWSSSHSSFIYANFSEEIQFRQNNMKMFALL